VLAAETVPRILLGELYAAPRPLARRGERKGKDESEKRRGNGGGRKGEKEVEEG